MGAVICFVFESFVTDRAFTAPNSELEKENRQLKAQVAELQKRIQELEAEQKAAASKSRAQKLITKLEKQGYYLQTPWFFVCPALFPDQTWRLHQLSGLLPSFHKRLPLPRTRRPFTQWLHGCL
jgi:uncharacterized protein YcgL (UPF0745 family)